MKLLEAIAADRRGELQSAAVRYEEVLATGEPSLEVLLNLAILYWQATDAGMAAAKKLSPDLLATAGRRFPELLAEAERRFPASTEPHFWRRYIAWADLGEPFRWRRVPGPSPRRSGRSCSRHAPLRGQSRQRSRGRSA